MKFYLDTNVLIDFCLRREPHFDVATKILNFAFKKEIEIYTSSHCIATLHYICKRNFTEAAIREIISQLMEFMTVLPVTEEVLKKSLKSYHKDFEDAIQIFCAHEVKNMNGLITRNLKDFSTAEMQVFSPDEALYLIKENLNTTH